MEELSYYTTVVFNLNIRMMLGRISTFIHFTCINIDLLVHSCCKRRVDKDVVRVGKNSH